MTQERRTSNCRYSENVSPKRGIWKTLTSLIEPRKKKSRIRKQGGEQGVFYYKDMEEGVYAVYLEEKRRRYPHSLSTTESKGSERSSQSEESDVFSFASKNGVNKDKNGPHYTEKSADTSECDIYDTKNGAQDSITDNSYFGCSSTCFGSSFQSEEADVSSRTSRNGMDREENGTQGANIVSHGSIKNYFDYSMEVVQSNYSNQGSKKKFQSGHANDSSHTSNDAVDKERYDMHDASNGVDKAKYGTSAEKDGAHVSITVHSNSGGSSIDSKKMGRPKATHCICKEEMARRREVRCPLVHSEGPAPNRYVIPSLFGYRMHDPRFVRNPAYSMGKSPFKEPIICKCGKHRPSRPRRKQTKKSSKKSETITKK